MADLLRIQTETGVVQHPLERRVQRLGSDRGCEIIISHGEVTSHAATLDFRGGSFLFQNRNPFPVYLGSQPVPTDSWSVWQSGETLQLTRHVSLTLLADGNVPAKTHSPTVGSEFESDEAGAAVTASAPPDAGRKLTQLVVIAVCVVLGAILLITRPTPRIQTSDSFQDLIRALEAEDAREGPTRDRKIVRAYLQRAYWDVSKRSQRDRKAAIHSMEILLNHPSIRNAKPETTGGRIKRFAEQHLSRLFQNR